LTVLVESLRQDWLKSVSGLDFFLVTTSTFAWVLC
jgi:hypothetical protein